MHEGPGLASGPFAFQAAITRDRTDYLLAAMAIRLLWRAAAFAWMRPLRAARSSRLTAFVRSSALAVGAFAFLSAVRSAERCARLRTVAALDFLMFFFADAIFGTS